MTDWKTTRSNYCTEEEVLTKTIEDLSSCPSIRERDLSFCKGVCDVFEKSIKGKRSKAYKLCFFQTSHYNIVKLRDILNNNGFKTDWLENLINCDLADFGEL